MRSFRKLLAGLIAPSGYHVVRKYKPRKEVDHANGPKEEGQEEGTHQEEGGKAEG